MDKFWRIPIRTFKHRKIYYNQVTLFGYLKQIEDTLKGMDGLNNREFARRLFETIPNLELIKNSRAASEYILSVPNIDKESLRGLYEIVSDGELRDSELKSVGKYYRMCDEYLMSKTGLFVNSVGSSPEKIDFYMDELIDFINCDDDIDDFIKSQIIHIYFVYIHPYPNINGRISRLLSSWYLVTKQKYPLIVFNRVPSFFSLTYSEKIRSIYHFGNITPFLEFMMKNILKELKMISLVSNNFSLDDIDNMKFKILEYVNLLENKSLESISRMHSMCSNYMSLEMLKSEIDGLVGLGILKEENEEYKINVKGSL